MKLIRREVGERGTWLRERLQKVLDDLRNQNPLQAYADLSFCRNSWDDQKIICLPRLALTLSDGIVADSEVYDRLVRDVGQIRMEYPEVQAITYDGPEATSLTLEVDEATLNDMEHGRYSDWNCLNRVFRARDFTFVVLSSSTSVLFYFDGVTTHNYYYFRADADGDVVSGETWVIDEEGDPPAAPDWVAIFAEAGFNASPYDFYR